MPSSPTALRAWRELPQGAVVGTSSLRRVVLLRALRPDLKIEPLRGNLDTRLRKLDDGNYDAIVLAAAGLKRLGLGQRIRQMFEPEQMLPAAGQGALGIEARADRARRGGDPGAARAPGHLARGRGRARREPGHGRQLFDAAGRLCHLFGRAPAAARGLGRPRRRRGCWCGRSWRQRQPTWTRRRRWGPRWPRGCAPAAPTDGCRRHARVRHPARERGPALG